MANWTTITARYEHPIARSEYYCPDCGTNVPTLGPLPKFQSEYTDNTSIDVSDEGTNTLAIKDVDGHQQTFFEGILNSVPDVVQNYIYIENNDEQSATYGAMYRPVSDGSGYVKVDEFTGEADRDCLDTCWYFEDSYSITPRIK